MKEENTIGNMIARLESDLEACRAADRIIDNWKFLYSIADKNRKYELLNEMLKTIGFTSEEIGKILIRPPLQPNNLIKDEKEKINKNKLE